MKVLSIGATGYVGSRVVEKLLKQGYSVTGVTSRETAIESLRAKGVCPVVADLRETDKLIELAQVHDAIAYTAFLAHDASFSEAVEVEAQFLKALIQSLAGSGKTLILSNGTAFLGDSGTQFLDESAPVQLNHPTAIRAEIERLALEGNQQGLRVVSIRLASFVYGEGGSIFLPLLVQAARETGESIYVDDGNASISAVHVKDAAELYLLALQQPASGIYHCADRQSPTVKQLAEAIARGIGLSCITKSVTSEVAAQRLNPFLALFLSMNNRLSSQRAQQELGWQPQSQPGILADLEFGSYLQKKLQR